MFRVFLMATLLFLSKALGDPGQKSCSHDECLKLDRKIIAMMDKEVKPCDDFYNFVCGGFVKENQNSTINNFHLMSQKSIGTFNETISRINEESPKLQRMLRNYYQTCINRDGNKAAEHAARKAIIVALGGSYIFKEENPSEFSANSFSWEKISREIAGFNVLEINPRVLALYQRIELRPSFRYYKMDLSNPVFNFTFEDEKDVLEFQIKLLATLPLMQGANTFPLGDLQAIFPHFKIMEFIKSSTWNKIDITSQTPITVNLQYFTLLTDIYKDNPKLLSTYLLLQYFHGIEEETMKEYCFNLLTEDMDIALHNFVYQTMDHKSVLRTTKEIAGNVKREMLRKTKANPWIDAANKKKILKKITMTNLTIGFFDQLLDDSLVESYYKSFNIDPSSTFVDLRQQLRKMRQEAFLNSLDDRNSIFGQRRYTIQTLMVNAFRTQEFNAIYIPYGITQPPLVQANVPNFVNYAGIGFIIAHEFSHGFDPEGLQFDEFGMRTTSFIENNKTRMHFEEKFQCIYNQFNDFEEPMTKSRLNGKTTIKDNVADEIGIKLAYKAAFKSGAMGIVLPELGKSFSEKQQFWISFAANWCETMTPEMMFNIIKYDNHSPTRFRINGGLQNSLEFSKDFQCPEGSPMNPKKKCQIL